MRNERFNVLRLSNFKEIFEKVGQMVREFEKSLIKSKNNIEKNVRGSQESSSLLSLNSEVAELCDLIDDIQKVEYEKLLTLREKNNKLSIIWKHIKNLSEEN